jgi:putative ABC transport system permease protein
MTGITLRRPLGLLVQAAMIGPLRAAPGRTLLAALAIALGLAMGMAIYLINRTAADEVSLAARSLFGLADFTVRSTSAGFDEQLYAQLARLDGIELASPIVEVEARIPGERGTLTVLGIDPFRARRMLPPLAQADHGPRSTVFGTESLALSPAAARRLGVQPGDVLTLQLGLEPVRFNVAALLPASAYRDAVAVADIATVQWRFDRTGSLTRVDLRLKSGADRALVGQRIAALLPAGVELTTPGRETDEALRLSRAYRANLTALALVALFTGSFLVYATQSLAVSRRRREIGLLHAMGMTGREQVLLTLGSAVMVGAIGAVLGVMGGIAVARVGLRVFGADLGAGYFEETPSALDVQPLECIVFFLLGVTVAVVGAVRPAVAAARVPPAIALRSGDVEVHDVRGHAIAGLAVVALAFASLALPPIHGLPLPGHFAIALTLIAAIVLLPTLTRALFERLPQSGPPVWQVVAAQLRGNSAQITVSIAAVLVSFSLMVAMAIMVASFRDSLADWLDKVLPGDVYLRAGSTGDSGFLSPRILADLEAIPDVVAISSVRFRDVSFAAGQGPVTLVARPISRASARDTLWLEQTAAGDGAGRLPAWVSESAADLYGLEVAGQIQLALAGQTRSFWIAGTYRDYDRQNGAIVIDLDTYRRLTGDPNVNTAAFTIADGGDARAVALAVRERLPRDAAFDVALPGEIRARSLRIFDRTFAVTYLLEAVAVLIGLFGISSSMSAQVLARRAEFAMLRHIGFTRGQIATMLGVEGALLGLTGAVAGLVVGALVSLILIQVVNRQSFHWSMDLHVPYGFLWLLSSVLIGAAALTAMTSGRQAMSGATARAVREDW